MIFSKDFIQKVLLSTNLVEIVGKHTEVQFRSTQFIALCPYPDHREKTPSFSISEEKQVYHCFGCQKSGNVFTFLRDIRGLSFQESVKFLAERAGLPLPVPQKAFKKGQATSLSDDESSLSSMSQKRDFHERRKELLKIHHLSSKFFHQELLRSSSHALVKDYLKQRHLGEEIVKRFQIGWAPYGGSALLHFLKNQNLSFSLAEASGLLRRSKNKKELYDNFRGRLMFPIFSIQGQCVAFGGRALKEEQSPKYLNSPESEIFYKKEILYGLNESVRFIKQEDEVMVVEGYMDFLSLYQKEIKNVVATLGTALSSFHAKRLKNFTSHVLILFDGDLAGQKASKRALSLLLSEGLCPRVLELAEGLDPDEFIHKNGKNSLLLETRRAPDLFSVLLEKEVSQGIQNSSEKLRVVEKLSSLLISISNPRLRSLYTQELAQAVNVDPSWISRALLLQKREKKQLTFTYGETPSPSLDREEKFSNQKNQEKVNEEDSKMEIKEALLPAERHLLHLALMEEKHFVKITKKQVLSCLFHQGLVQIFALAKDIYRQDQRNFAKITSLLMLQVKPENILIPPPFIKDLESEEAGRLMRDCILRLRELKTQKKCQDLSERLEFASSPEESQALLRQFMKTKSEQKSKEIF